MAQTVPLLDGEAATTTSAGAAELAEPVVTRPGAVEAPIQAPTEPEPRQRYTAPCVTDRQVKGRRHPRWLRIVEQVHDAGGLRAAALADALVLAVAARLVGIALPEAVGVGIGFTLWFVLSGVYGSRSTLETQGVLWYPARVITPIAIASLVVGSGGRLLHIGHADSLRLAIVALAGLVALRALTWGVIAMARQHGLGLRPAVIVGAGPLARTVVSKLRMFPEAGLLPVGILSPDGERDMGEGVGIGALPPDLRQVIDAGQISHVVLIPEADDVAVGTCLELCDGLDVSFSLLPPLSDLFLHPTLITQVGGLPLIPLGKVARSRRSVPGKRVFDIAVTSVLTLLTAPVMVAVALAVRLSDKGPVLYRQKRVGRDGRVFEMLKFRSMVMNADQMVIDLRAENATDGLLFKVWQDPRVTRVGRVIRKLSLDELPQLWNVLRGDMSLVGPRPLPVSPDAFGPLDGKRHVVPPGITGYWQIAGGNGLTYQEMVKLDFAYIQNWSIWLDVRLLAKTLPVVIHRSRREPC